MKITLGGLNVGDGEEVGVTMDLQRFLASKLLLQANSGGGKSWAIRRLLEQSHGHVQQIVIDVEDEFYTLREKFDYILARHDGGDCVPEVRSAELLARRILELGVNAIVSIFELKPRDRREFVKRFLDALTNAPKNLWHPMILVLDESHEFCPEQGRGRDDSGGCADAVIEFMSKGRKRGFCGVLATQRISKLNKDAAAECNNKLIGRASIDVDRKRAAEELGFTGKEDVLSLRKLTPGQFYGFGPAISDEVILFRTGPVSTTHPKAGAAPTRVAPPKKKVLSILAKLADLPKEAEQERATLDGLKRENAQLKTDLRAADAAAQAVQTLQEKAKPVVEEKKVEIAILKAADVKKLEAAGARFQEAGIRVAKVGDDLIALIRKFVPLPPDGTKLVFERGTASVRQPTHKAALEGAHNAIHRKLPIARPPKAPPAAAAKVDGDFRPNGPQQKILNTLANFEAMGLGECERNQVALFSDASPTSSTYGNNVSDLRVAGLIDYPVKGKLQLTDAGRSIAIPESVFKSVDELHQSWIQKLGPTRGKLLEVLIAAYPNPLTRTELADAVVAAGGKASPTSSTFGNNVSDLSTLGLVTYPRQGSVVATALLFPPI